MTNYTLKNVSERDLKNYELSVTNSYRKIPKIPLPPSVTSRVLPSLTPEYGNTNGKLKAAEERAKAIVDELRRVIFKGRKLSQYKITISISCIGPARHSLDSVHSSL